MRFPIARSLALATLVPALLLFVFVPGCAKQSEGERCGNDTYGVDNGDCEDGLICVASKQLLNNAANRCCYADHVSDSRCEPAGPGTPSAGGSGGGSGSAGGGSAGASEGGSSGEAGSVSEGGSSGEAGGVSEGGSSGEAGSVSVAGGTGGAGTGGAGTGGTSGAGTGGGR